MQVDPIKPALKAPGIRPLKLKCDEPLSNFALNFNLRRYNQAMPTTYSAELRECISACLTKEPARRPDLDEAVQVDPIKPMLKAPSTKRLKL